MLDHIILISMAPLPHCDGTETDEPVRIAVTGFGVRILVLIFCSDCGLRRKTAILESPRQSKLAMLAASKRKTAANVDKGRS